MRLLRGTAGLARAAPECVVTFGNFDGLHLGHQALLARLRRAAAERGLPATVLITEPLSREFFRPQPVVPRLTNLRERLGLLARYGVDQVALLRFDARLAALGAEDFAETILARGLGARHVVLGDDSRFGRGRAGDAALLGRLGARLGFDVETSPTVTLGRVRVSSSRVRAALAAGDLDTARALLGRDYHLAGRVVHGDKRGRRLGFPTANVQLKRRAAPLEGVFAVRVALPGGRWADGVASVGRQPTFGGAEPRLEVHLFDFTGDLYRTHLEVYFLARLRGQRRFADAAALCAQMAEDARRARARLAELVDRPLLPGPV